LSGTRLYVDNATDAEVDVIIDGVRIGTVPPLSYRGVEVRGRSCSIQARSSGSDIEEADVLFETNVVTWIIKRALWNKDDQAFIYNVAGANEYNIRKVTYQVSP
jgi:hypothetical protein